MMSIEGGKELGHSDVVTAGEHKFLMIKHLRTEKS